MIFSGLLILNFSSFFAFFLHFLFIPPPRFSPLLFLSHLSIFSYIIYNAVNVERYLLSVVLVCIYFCMIRTYQCMTTCYWLIKSSPYLPPLSLTGKSHSNKLKRRLQPSPATANSRQYFPAKPRTRWKEQTQSLRNQNYIAYTQQEKQSAVQNMMKKLYTFRKFYSNYDVDKVSCDLSWKSQVETQCPAALHYDEVWVKYYCHSYPILWHCTITKLLLLAKWVCRSSQMAGDTITACLNRDLIYLCSVLATMSSQTLPETYGRN